MPETPDWRAIVDALIPHADERADDLEALAEEAVGDDDGGQAALEYKDLADEARAAVKAARDALAATAPETLADKLSEARGIIRRLRAVADKVNTFDGDDERERAAAVDAADRLLL